MPRGKERSVPEIVDGELDAHALRALAHPLRLQILELLDDGPSTASRVAQQLAESSGATSYHLRELERHGFVEEVDRGTARERWWKRTERRATASAGTAQTPAYRAAYAQLRSAVLERDRRVLSDFLANEAEYPPEWREAASFLNSTVYATPRELEQLTKDIRELLRPLRRPHRDEVPQGARRVYVGLRALPWWR
jgi:DNA-binding transcriptional ArsR family regulator